MFAVLEVSGHQEIIKAGDVIEVNKLIDAKEGATIHLDKVLCLFTPDGKTVEVGFPYLTGKKVSAKVVTALYAGEKVVGVKFKRRKRYMRTFGHRQDLTKLQIEKIG